MRKRNWSDLKNKIYDSSMDEPAGMIFFSRSYQYKNSQILNKSITLTEMPGFEGVVVYSGTTIAPMRFFINKKMTRVLDLR